VARPFLIGLLIGVVLVMGGIYFYFATGAAPAAVNDPPMPFEKKMASKSLNAHIDKQGVPAPPISPDETNLTAGAKLYKAQCAGCHGLPGQPPPDIADGMYPHAPLLFKGKGVTDDPPSESYWKVANGIRLTGMPSFKPHLTDTQLWQLALVVAHANELPESARKELLPDPVPAGLPPVPPMPVEVPRTN